MREMVGVTYLWLESPVAVLLAESEMELSWSANEEGAPAVSDFPSGPVSEGGGGGGGGGGGEGGNGGGGGGGGGDWERGGVGWGGGETGDRKGRRVLL